jgi:hypothetical protein
MLILCSIYEVRYSVHVSAFRQCIPAGSIVYRVESESWQCIKEELISTAHENAILEALINDMFIHFKLLYTKAVFCLRFY